MKEKLYKDMTEGEFLKAVGMDGQKWLDAFYEINPDCNIDRATMQGWFCNTIMAGYDHARGVPIHIEDDRFGKSPIEQAQPTAEVEPSCELIKKINILLLNFAQHEYYNEIAEVLNECKKGVSMKKKDCPVCNRKDLDCLHCDDYGKAPIEFEKPASQVEPSCDVVKKIFHECFPWFTNEGSPVTSDMFAKKVIEALQQKPKEGK